MSKPVYDSSKQLERIQQYVIDGETLVAVYDCKGGGTGFVGITDQRVIFPSKCFLICQFLSGLWMQI